MEKSKNLHQQLKDLKSEIEVLKVEEKQTHLDRLHEEKSEAGDNKFITLQKVNSPFLKKKIGIFVYRIFGENLLRLNVVHISKSHFRIFRL